MRRAVEANGTRTGKRDANDVRMRADHHDGSQRRFDAKNFRGRAVAFRVAFYKSLDCPSARGSMSLQST